MDWISQVMKFNPETKTLMTRDGRMIKALSCHLNVRLNQLQVEPDGHRRCDRCDHRVLDTGLLSEAQIVEQVAADPATCLIVRRGQRNIDIV